MESFKCKFCFKSFVNGRALGGHMRRSHIPNFCIDEEVTPSQLSDDTDSYVSSSSSSSESETAPSTNMINLTRKRSKRTRKLDSFTKKSPLGYKTEPEPHHSSASDTTTEEDLAFCLMMLSRDKWKRKKMNRATTKERFTCETCGKVFKSYQALGGHRASHKKNRVSNKTEQRSETEYVHNVVLVSEKRIHECPICLRVFTSGQALGGHKRSHGLGNLSVNHHQVHRTESVKKQRMIDLNLPAPREEEEVSVVFQ